MELYLQSYNGLALLELFDEVKKDPSVKPDVFCYNMMVNLFSSHPLGKYPEQAMVLYKEMKAVGVQPNIFTYNKLIDMFFEKRQLGYIRVVVDDMLTVRRILSPSIIAYGFNTLIALTCDSADSKSQLMLISHFMKQMKKVKLTPTVVTYNLFLRAILKLDTPATPLTTYDANSKPVTSNTEGTLFILHVIYFFRFWFFFCSSILFCFLC
jgi:hypothetical protein